MCVFLRLYLSLHCWYNSAMIIPNQNVIITWNFSLKHFNHIPSSSTLFPTSTFAIFLSVVCRYAGCCCFFGCAPFSHPFPPFVSTMTLHPSTKQKSINWILKVDSQRSMFNFYVAFFCGQKCVRKQSFHHVISYNNTSMIRFCVDEIHSICFAFGHFH